MGHVSNVGSEPDLRPIEDGKRLFETSRIWGSQILGLPNHVAIKHLCLWAGGQASAQKFDLGMFNLAKHG